MAILTLMVAAAPAFVTADLGDRATVIDASAAGNRYSGDISTMPIPEQGRAGDSVRPVGSQRGKRTDDRQPLVVDVGAAEHANGLTTATPPTVEVPDGSGDGEGTTPTSAPPPPKATSETTMRIAPLALGRSLALFTRDDSPARSATAQRPPPTTSGTTTPTSASTTTQATSAPTRPEPTITAATPSTGGGGIVWEEHFNDLDTSRWQPEHSTYGDGNGELQCYRPENVRVADGRLILTARSEQYTCPSGARRSVTSGMVRSHGLSFSPGQGIEFRVKLTPPEPSNQGGLWPAVWASSWAPGGWPAGGELDWLEVMTAEDPGRAVFSMHYADRSGHHDLQNKAVPLPSYFSDQWHVIRFHYGRSGRLTWFLDGREVYSVNAADTAQGYPAPFDSTIDEIKINLAVGGTPGPLSSGALGTSGATFEVDYIKVFNL